MLKTIIHRPAQGLEGRCASCLRDTYARTVALRPDGVELDVRVTADGIPVVAHDVFTRLRSAAPRPLHTVRHADLSSDAFLRLDELMPVFAGFAGRVYVEIKDVREASVSRVLEVLEPFRPQVWFISLPWKSGALRRVLARWSDARVNQIVIHPALSHLEKARRSGVGAVTFGWSRVNTLRMVDPAGGFVRRFVDGAREAGIEASAGLANSAADLSWAVRMGFEMVWVDPHMLDLARSTISGNAGAGTA